MDTGFWDDPYAYDATYENCDEWGARRWSTPGAIIDGRLVTTRLTDLNMGFEEFVSHSYYDEWQGDRFATDPLSNALSPYHPWNKQTLPKPSGRDWKERYTWSTAPRWDRNLVEAGCHARLFITTLARQQPRNQFMESTGRSLDAGAQGPAPGGRGGVVVPDTWNALERNRAGPTTTCSPGWSGCPVSSRPTGCSRPARPGSPPSTPTSSSATSPRTSGGAWAGGAPVAGGSPTTW